jgi:hypothetical protein
MKIIKELEVYTTPDGLGRGALVEDSTGCIRLFIHWKWAAETRAAFNVAPGGATNWADDQTPVDALYEDIEPEAGIYASLETARSELFAIPAFVDAELMYKIAQ